MSTIALRLTGLSGKRKRKWCFNMGRTGLFLFYFLAFLNTMANIVQNLTLKAQMVCLGFESGIARWKLQTNPLSYGSSLP